MKRGIKQNDFKKGLPQEFEVLDMSFLFDSFYEEIIEPHRNEFYQILWFKNSNCYHTVDFNRIKIEPNTLLFLNKNSVQQFDKQVSSQGKVILFTDGFYGEAASDLEYLKSSILFNDLLSIPTVSLNQNQDVFSVVLDQMEQELSVEKDRFQSSLVRNYLKNFLLLSERMRRNQNFGEIKKGPDLTLVMRFRELLESQFDNEKLVSQYVSQLLVTKKRLNEATSKVLGKTPKEIIDHRVMLEAKRLLAHTHDTVKEIGYRIGFKEPTNFVKYFKNHNNHTPNEFRESLKE